MVPSTTRIENKIKITHSSGIRNPNVDALSILPSFNIKGHIRITQMVPRVTMALLAQYMHNKKLIQKQSEKYVQITECIEKRNRVFFKISSPSPNPIFIFWYSSIFSNYKSSLLRWSTIEIDTYINNATRSILTYLNIWSNTIFLAKQLNSPGRGEILGKFIL